MICNNKFNYFIYDIMKKIGREVLFLNSKENNPRNGEGTFLRLKNGNIVLQNVIEIKSKL